MQLRLLPPSRPLQERFDAKFFRSIPKQPGVYIMRDEAERIIYVGKSVNLRQRVGSYRYVNSERDSRKTVRLVAQIRKIAWEICESDEQARLRENALLREHKPRWNVMNTRPEHYAFFGMALTDNTLTLRLTKEPQPLPDERLFGAFKGITRARVTFVALLRCLWFANDPGVSFHQMPMELNRSRPPGSCEFAVDDKTDRMAAVQALALDFFEGRSQKLVEWLMDLLLESGETSPFQRALHEADLETLTAFYRIGPRRNRRFQSTFALGDGLIEKERVDDLLILSPEIKEDEE